jgi:hypothetical protein
MVQATIESSDEEEGDASDPAASPPETAYMRSGEGKEHAEDDSPKVSSVGISRFHISALVPDEICTQGIANIAG